MNDEWEKNKVVKITQFIYLNIWPIVVCFILSLPIVVISVLQSTEILKILIFSLVGPIIYALFKYYLTELSEKTGLRQLILLIIKYFKRGLIITLIYLLVVVLFLFNINYYNSSSYSAISFLFFILLFLSTLAYFYFVLIDSYFSFRLIDIFKLIMVSIFTKPRNSIVNISFIIIMFYCITKIPNTMMFLVVFIVIALIANSSKNLIQNLQATYTKEKDNG